LASRSVTGLVTASGMASGTASGSKLAMASETLSATGSESRSETASVKMLGIQLATVWAIPWVTASVMASGTQLANT